MIKIAPSILSADFSQIRSEIEKINSSTADLIHYDVMDGVFVPPITFGHQLIAEAQKHTKLPADVHLMIVEPWKHFESFAKAQASMITFHYEAAVHHHRHIQEIKSFGLKAGLSIVPSTPVEQIFPILHELDLVLVMSVNPGYGGQSFLKFCLQKIQILNEFRKTHHLDFLISVDGGINLDTSVQVKQAGADILVTGSAFFSATDPKDYVQRLRI
jgi:ribulose-phosphate 3-epimerase